jgi:hypothetical protein
LLKYIVALSLILLAPDLWAADWEIMKKDNYASLASGDDRFFLGCYPSGISMEYANAKEVSCSAATKTCTYSVDYDAQGTQPISLIMDEGSMSLYKSGADASTIPLGYVDMSQYKGVEDQEELGAFSRTKKLQLVFPALSRTVTFDNIQNGSELVGFFTNCIREAEGYQKQQSELRKKQEDKAQGAAQ